MQLPLEREITGRAVELVDGFWLLATRHRGGGFSMFPEMNNRSFILRLIDQTTGQPCLVALNATDPKQSLAQVGRVCQQTGLALGYVISTSGAHHSYMGAWHQAFEAATLLLGAERVPRTANGKELLQLQRVQIMDAGDPLPMFRDQLEAVTFTGLLGAKEFASPTEGERDSTWRALAAMRRLATPTDHDDQLWVHHPASATVIAGENVAPYFSKRAHAKLSWLVRKTLACEKVKLSSHIWDPEAVARGWQTVTTWKATTMLGIHDGVTSGLQGDVPQYLRKAAQEAGQLALSHI